MQRATLTKIKIIYIATNIQSTITNQQTNSLYIQNKHKNHLHLNKHSNTLLNQQTISEMYTNAIKLCKSQQSNIHRNRLHYNKQSKYT